MNIKVNGKRVTNPIAQLLIGIASLFVVIILIAIIVVVIIPLIVFIFVPLAIILAIFVCFVAVIFGLQKKKKRDR